MLKEQREKLEMDPDADEFALDMLAEMEQDILDGMAVTPDEMAELLLDLGVLETYEDVERWQQEHKFQTVSQTSEDGKLYWTNPELEQQQPDPYQQDPYQQDPY